jgi:type I restriction-modification system DNA methylase subunit
MIKEFEFLQNLPEKVYNEELFLTGNVFSKRNIVSPKTPEGIAQRMVSKIRLIVGEDIKVLEPCAGQGGILEVVNSKVGGKIYFNEVQGALKKDLKEKFPNAKSLTTEDSLSPKVYHNYWKRFDLVVMNPPFNKCIQFATTMLNYYLKEHGQLITLFPTLQLANLNQNKNFLAHIFTALSVEIERLPEFDCGYGAKVSLISIVK